MSKVPHGLLAANSRIGGLLAKLSLEDAAIVLIHQLETMGIEETETWTRYRDGRQRAGRIGAERTAARKLLLARLFARDGMVCGICKEALFEGDKIHVDHILPRARGGSDDFENLQPSHYKCNLQKGDLRNKRSVAGKLGVSKREANRMQKEANAKQTRSKQDAKEQASLLTSSRALLGKGVGGFSLSSDLDLPLSQRSGEVTGQVSTGESPGDGAPNARGVGPSPSAEPAAVAAAPDPARRLNPVALVEHFQAGVNEAGGVWTPGGRGPCADLAQALQPHATRLHVPGESSIPLERCKALGRRWLAFCGGAPRDAWKAAAWLGEDAPASPRASPAMAADDAADRARRSREAETRENDRRRTRDLERRSSAPPEALALVASLGRADPPSGVQRVASADEQADELQRLFAAEGE